MVAARKKSVKKVAKKGKTKSPAVKVSALKKAHKVELKKAVAKAWKEGHKAGVAHVKKKTAVKKPKKAKARKSKKSQAKK